MSNPGEADLTPITAPRQLAEWFAAGSKPRARLGRRHRAREVRLPPRRPRAARPTRPDGIRAMLEGMAARQGWDAHPRRRQPDRAEARRRLDQPGAGRAVRAVGRACCPTCTRRGWSCGSTCARCTRSAGRWALGFAPLGFHPLAARDAMPWMPKGRYAIMRRYMPTVGRLGLDMMLRTCTVQANLDYGDEADMVEKLRVSLALQPVATALFANSPFTEGKPNGFRSMRAQVWTDTDRDPHRHPRRGVRAGLRLRALRRMAARRADVLRHARRASGSTRPGRSFRAFMEGRLGRCLPGERATMGDFADHVTTAFTDVRLKRFLEMRGADAGSPAMMVAKPALWVGLLYDDAAQKAAAALIRGLDGRGDPRAARMAVPRDALRRHDPRPERAGRGARRAGHRPRRAEGARPGRGGLPRAARRDRRQRPDPGRPAAVALRPRLGGRRAARALLAAEI